MPRATAAAKADHGDDNERAGRDVGPQGTTVQLVERVRGEPDGEKERQQRGHQPRQVDRWCQAGADHDVGQMPCCIGGVEQGPPIAPTAGPSSVEGRPTCRFRLAVPMRDPCSSAWSSVWARQSRLRVPHITRPPPRLITRTPTFSNPALATRPPSTTRDTSGSAGRCWGRGTGPLGTTLDPR